MGRIAARLAIRLPAADEPIVVNTGPVIALEACRQLLLLRALHSRVIMPADVALELTRGASRGVGGPRWPSSTEWIEVLPTAAPPPPLLAAHLDPGEAAVIALALERGISLVLIDERRGRMVARTLDLRVTGSVGVRRRAKKEGREDQRAIGGDRLGFAKRIPFRREPPELTSETFFEAAVLAEDSTPHRETLGQSLAPTR